MNIGERLRALPPWVLAPASARRVRPRFPHERLFLALALAGLSWTVAAASRRALLSATIGASWIVLVGVAAWIAHHRRARAAQRRGSPRLDR